MSMQLYAVHKRCIFHMHRLCAQSRFWVVHINSAYGICTVYAPRMCTELEYALNMQLNMHMHTRRIQNHIRVKICTQYAAICSSTFLAYAVVCSVLCSRLRFYARFQILCTRYAPICTVFICSRMHHPGKNDAHTGQE